MSDSDVAIRVEGLGNKYKLGLTHKGTVRDVAAKLFGRKGARCKVECPPYISCRRIGCWLTQTARRIFNPSGTE